MMGAWPCIPISENSWYSDLSMIESQILDSQSSTDREILFRQVLQHGVDAVPVLEKIALVDDRVLVIQALQALSRLGPLAWNAEATLVRLSQRRDPELNQWIYLALCRINLLSVSIVVNALHDEHPLNREYATVALQEKFQDRLQKNWSDFITALQVSTDTDLLIVYRSCR